MLQHERKWWWLTRRLSQANADEIEAVWLNLPSVDKNDDYVLLVFVIALARIGEFGRARCIAAPLLVRWEPRFGTNFHLIANKLMLTFSKLGLIFLSQTVAFLYLSIVKKANPYSAFGNMYLAMWTDHEKALAYTTNLFAGHLLRRQSADCRYLYFHGFILALNGLIDEGLALCEQGVTQVQTLRDEEFGLFWLHEGMSLAATVSFYAGDVDRALAVHNHVQKIFLGPDVFAFNEVYNSSMCLRVALAARDYGSFSSHKLLLKKIMGIKYDLRFALRTYSFEAVFESLRRDPKAAYVAMSKADSFAEKSPSKIELYYHFTQKSRLFLVDGMINEAIALARESSTGIAKTSGAGFHVADAHFQHLRCLIVGHATLAIAKERALQFAKEEKLVLEDIKSVTRHSKFMRAKLSLYRKLLIMARQGTESDLISAIKEHNLPGYDLDEVSLAIENQHLRDQKLMVRHEAMQAATLELERISKLNEYLQMISEEKVRQRSHLTELSREYLSECTGTKVSVTINSGQYCDLEYKGVLALRANEAFIKPFDACDGMLFHIKEAGDDFAFNQDLIGVINVWWQITNGRLNELHRQNELVEQSKYRAIAQTTQMLAHDVRKPFSLIRGILTALSSADKSNAGTIAEAFLPDVDRAIKSVNGMIDDVMEIGSEKELTLDEFSLVSLIKDALAENCRYYAQCDFRFSSDFKHSNLVKVDQQRISRVFSNIIGNAIQATGGVGHLWFHSKDRGQFIEVIIGNDGSYISEDKMQRIFDAFYTADKPGGTGLGLAIAKKIIEAHGGKIWCRSSAEQQVVSFHFLIPKGRTCSSTNEKLPLSSALIQNNKVSSPSGSFMTYLPSDINVPALSSGHYVVVDDDAFIRYAWTELDTLKNVTAYESPEQFWTAVKRDPLLLREALGIATDYHFSEKSKLNGLQFADELRRKGYDGRIILCSDHDAFDDTLLTGNVVVASKDPMIASTLFH